MAFAHRTLGRNGLNVSAQGLRYRHEQAPTREQAEAIDDFEQIVGCHSGALRRHAARLAGGSANAEDLVQEAYLRAWRSFHTFTPGSNARAWLFRILHNTYIDTRRAAARAVRTTGEGDAGDHAGVAPDTPETPIEARLIEARLQRALASVPDRFRPCIILVDLRGWSYNEVAHTLGIPTGTVMSRLHRARAAMRRALIPAPSRGNEAA
jgi:RNA polymerase sigma-70 factor (ECF subfamily)